MGKSGNICSVAICKSPQDASYHHFPTEEKVKKVWIARCNRKDSINPLTAKICSKHFTEEDFVRDFQAELTGQKRRRRLNPGSVPTINLKPVLGDLNHNKENQNAAGKI